jgi:hypothetical protein
MFAESNKSFARKIRRTIMAGLVELKAKAKEDKALAEEINAATLGTLVEELKKKGYDVTKEELIAEAKLKAGSPLVGDVVIISWDYVIVH